MADEVERKKIAHRHPYKPETTVIDDATMRGMAIRLDMLQTHYRQPKNFKLDGLNAAAKTLRRWYSRMEQTTAAPPVEFIKALEDDLNTPKAVTLLHMYAKDQPQALYAGLNMMGLIPGSIMREPHELKTIPIDHIALPAWEWESERTLQ